MRPPLRLVWRRRPAFTLVEMIVVLSIVLALSALAVALAPRWQERQKTARAADQLQGWLSMVRQWARRDRVPTGIRLQPGRVLPNPVNADINFVTELQYIQQPPDFVVQPGLTPADPVNMRRIQVVSSSTPPNPPVYDIVLLEPIPPGPPITPPPNDFSGGYGFSNAQLVPNAPDLWAVQPAPGLPPRPPDYLEIKGGGLMHRIESISYTGPPSGPYEANTLKLANPLPHPVDFTKEYRIVRRPRVLPGEAGLQIGQDVAIDLHPGKSFPDLHFNSVNSPPIDILFAPSGAVMASGANDKIILWVRDVTQDAATPGDQTLITIYVRTGLIAAHPVNTDPNVANGDPYYYTRDGRSSGL